MANLYIISKTFLDPVFPSPSQLNLDVLLVCFSVIIRLLGQQKDFLLSECNTFVTKFLCIVCRKISFYLLKNSFEELAGERERDNELVFAGITLLIYYLKHDRCSE